MFQNYANYLGSINDNDFVKWLFSSVHRFAGNFSLEYEKTLKRIGSEDTKDLLAIIQVDNLEAKNFFKNNVVNQTP